MPDTIKTEGRWVFTLSKTDSDGTKITEREITNPFPKNQGYDPSQADINAAVAYFTSDTNRRNKIVQPNTWRDLDQNEGEWTTTDVRYEMITTQTQVFEFDDE